MTGRVETRGTSFRDSLGRHLILRGVNFGADVKLPSTPNGQTHIPTDFRDHRTVSFVGRPAPLEELDGHLARLRHWGFNCLRLLVSWEGIEHAGPGEYDEAYLDYYAEVCRRAGEHGLRVFVDFHQDAWSRMSGGDGAPGWTLEAAGLDFTKFGTTGAAHVMQYVYDPAIGGHQNAYPMMSWSGNYARPANGIMWTLFFAGEELAPTSKVEGVNIQTYLQDHYFGAVRAVAERVADFDHVIGFDTLNEPGTGYIGRAMSSPIVRYRGPIWTAVDGLALASGLTREFPVVAPGRGVVGSEVFNAVRDSIWLPGREDPFRTAGAWDLVDGAPVVLREDYFQKVGDRQIDIGRDYMTPFFHRMADTVRSIRPDWLLFGEVDPFEAVLGHGFPKDCPDQMVNASHWYDLTAMVTKRFSTERMDHVLTGQTREGPLAIEDGYVEEMSMIKALGDALNGGSPTLLGECGIQYDMNESEAYHRWASGQHGAEIWSSQTSALDLMYNAIDRLLISSTQWNYNVSNSNDPMILDGWNQEDLSVWSRDQDTGEPHSGGRAIEGFVRPFVRAAQGRIVSQKFDRSARTFSAVIEVDASIKGPTEIYLPDIQFPNGVNCTAEGASLSWDGQILSVTAENSGPLHIEMVAS